MAAQKRKKRTTAGKKRSSSALVVWSIIIVSLLVIGYFTYPQLKPWFIERVNSKETKITEPVTSKNTTGLTANVWVNEMDGSMLSFKGNGSFSIDFPSVDQSRQLQGRYQVQTNTIQMTYSENAEICLDEQGSYRFSIKEGQLHFEAVKDPCKERKELLLSGWFRL